MPKGNFDPLFQLINSLSKAEKRHFKLHVGQVNAKDSKFVQLFDYLCNQENYDEQHLLKKLPQLKPSQLSNLKAHLFRQIMNSLRLLNQNDVDITIRDLINNATILFNKCLYDSSRKQLNKAKSLALKNRRNTLLLEIADFDKKLIIKIIKGNISNQVDEAIDTSKAVITSLNNINVFKDLSLKLYAHYLKIGFIKNDDDLKEIRTYINEELSEIDENTLGFGEKQHLYQLLTGYYFFIQDFDKAYKYALKWTSIYSEDAIYPIANTENYIKSINNLAVAQSKLFRLKEFNETIQIFDSIKENKEIYFTDNLNVLLFKYKATAVINSYFITGRFKEGISIIPELAEELDNYEDYLDAHWRLIFYYKFACMEIGASNYNNAINWINLILNSKDVELRSDILVFARVLNLVCHWELSNTELMEYHIRSTYRFFHKKNNFNLYQKAIIRFLRKASTLHRSEMKEAFIDLKEQLIPLENHVIEKRAFIYFDIISWLEAKIEGRTIGEVMLEKTKKRIQ